MTFNSEGSLAPLKQAKRAGHRWHWERSVRSVRLLRVPGGHALDGSFGLAEPGGHTNLKKKFFGQKSDVQILLKSFQPVFISLSSKPDQTFKPSIIPEWPEKSEKQA